MRRLSRWIDRLGQNAAFLRCVTSVLVLLALLNVYLVIRWWDKRYPKPPLGILRGELLKDYDRYSPDDKYTETSEVFSADYKPTEACITPACKWLQRETPNRATYEACDNFYEHVCSGLEPLYLRASEDLMVAVIGHVLKNATWRSEKQRKKRSQQPDDVRMLRKCVKGESDASDFAFGWSIQEFSISSTLEHKKDFTPKGITTDGKEAVCRWIADSARCHLTGRFRASGAVLTQYQQLWNELFFAPLFVTQEDSMLWDLVGSGRNARKRACVHIYEVLFRMKSVEAATAVLNKNLVDVKEKVGQALENVQHMLSQRVPYWLSRHEEDELLRYQVGRRPAYLAELQAVRAELAGVSKSSASDLGTSVFSWKVKYDRVKNVLTVPHGLVSIMARSDMVEPVFAVPVSAPLMRLLLPRPGGPYSWMPGHDQHLAYVTECFRSVHNASLDVDDNSALLEQLVYESALLGPLYDVYRMTIFENFDESVRLHDRYDNWQLFYVIWTMTHCGDPRRAQLVNAVLRNSVRFTRSFNCGLKDAMYQRRKCNFWVYW
ncbi:hypothetical protein HPB50_005138 [Hyalomma asiaticum]|uniref:Uncharacterized protein n=1 Tax=Hyalomma asiaticum TaxID=266040 RepID=A0ACB7RPR8_HYAAI|nr:hypothetical protein HPB50_005138 [Hyalomma asiaticum]